MSLASVRSSRGDSYEILIALRWAIRMLHDPDIRKIAALACHQSGIGIRSPDWPVEFHQEPHGGRVGGDVVTPLVPGSDISTLENPAILDQLKEVVK